MSSQDTIRIGIIGMGNMGQSHARNILDGHVPGCRLAAICDPKIDSLPEFGNTGRFATPNELIASGTTDAVIIATPHFDHVPVGIAALEAGLHVLVEKPVAVHKADALRLLAAHTDKSKVFAAMFNQRTDPCYQAIRNLITRGELGQVRRIQWTVTNWFRTQAYYDSGGWRATWAGEGGGVLLNQCPHQLDLWQWLFGMPSKVRAFCGFGRYHDIEVEDDVTAWFEYPNGTTGTFITSTGEAPGTNRLEIVADRGRVVVENGKIHFTRNEIPMDEFLRTDPGRFTSPPVWEVDIPVTGGAGPQHVGILRNFAAAILRGEELLSPAEEGIRSVELANAMLMSGLMDCTITLPIDADAYESLLKEKAASSRVVKKQAPASSAADDFAASFRR